MSVEKNYITKTFAFVPELFKAGPIFSYNTEEQAV